MNVRVFQRTLLWCTGTGAVVGLVWHVVLVGDGESTDPAWQGAVFVLAGTALLALVGFLVGAVVGLPLALLVRKPLAGKSGHPDTPSAWDEED